MVNICLLWQHNMAIERCVLPQTPNYPESSVCAAFAFHQHHVTIFLDLEKAYDRTWQHGFTCFLQLWLTWQSTYFYLIDF